MTISGGRRELGTPGEAADASHVSLDTFAQILQQMKAISDLSGLRRSLPNALCVETAAVAADDFDFRMLLDPIRRLSGGAGFEDVCNDRTLKIDNDRSVIKPFAPAPIINRDRAQGSAIGTFRRMTFELPQNRIVADGHRQARKQFFARPAASGVAEQSHELGNALCFSRKGKSRLRSFDESLSRARLIQASPPSKAQRENDRGALDWQVLQAPDVPTMT